MIQKEKHAEYAKQVMRSRDILYYITEQDRMSTLYWSINSLKMLKDPTFQIIKPQAIQFVLSCLKDNGGFGPTKEYSENIVSTFNALQILFLYDVPYYDRKTVDFILSLQRPDGAFIFDYYGDLDTRFDCCGINSLHLLSIMKEVSHLDQIAAREICTQLSGLPDVFTEDSSLENTQCTPIENVTVKLNHKLLSLKINQEFVVDIGWDLKPTLNHLLECFNHDGGAGQLKGSESHAAQVFCVLSSLRTLGCLHLIDRHKTVDFLVYRQLSNGGLCGRVNKKEDVCYSFWAYSSLVMLEAEYIDVEKLREFVMRCEGENGGFSDRPGNEPDVYHMMFSLASLSLMGCEGFSRIDPGFAL